MTNVVKLSRCINGFGVVWNTGFLILLFVCSLYCVGFGIMDCLV